MILEKYDRAPILFDNTRVYEQRVHHKPRGMWVSVKGDDDWPSWCRNEEWNVDGLTHRHEVEIADGWDIVNLSNPKEILDFHAEFKAPLVAGLEYEYIDWQRVAGLYDGIIIAPYQWSLRLDHSVFWYYSWDVASGCIWNLEAIESVTLKEVTTFELDRVS